VSLIVDVLRRGGANGESRDGIHFDREPLLVFIQQRGAERHFDQSARPRRS
jgi:hypothetical protein